MAADKYVQVCKVAGKACYAGPDGVKVGSRGKVRPYDNLRIADKGQKYAYDFSKGDLRRIRRGLKGLGFLRLMYATFGPDTRLPRRV